jgi:Na+/proline symporter
MLFGLYWKRATRWGVLASMGGGLTSALLWMGIGSPYGLHGFIPGILVSLVAMVIVSLITERLPDDHLERVWGER